MSQLTQHLEGTKRMFYTRTKEFEAEKRVGERLSLRQAENENI